ncbi:hypothetical protein B0H14DRAFT_3458562 [Mycena olivaceomarginata]|nr:hypothetical protein B0H14DRAFT_3458562 [Mycena olivaceomarginata]
MHRAHTDAEARAHIVEWVTKSIRPPNIVNDHEFHTLMTASFKKCKATIDNPLQVCVCMHPIFISVR